MKYALIAWLLLVTIARADFVLLVQRATWSNDSATITRQLAPFIPAGAVVGEPTWRYYVGTTNNVWGVMRWTGIMVDRELRRRPERARQLTNDKLPAIRLAIPSAATNELTAIDAPVARPIEIEPVAVKRGDSVLTFTDDYRGLLRKLDLRDIPHEVF